MICSALFMGLIGIALSFLPQELLNYLAIPYNSLLQVLIQLMSALYLAFAMLNWMAKSNLIGGIYSRPLAVGNFTHFFIGAITLLKAGLSAQFTVLWVIAIPYVIFAFFFGHTLFTHPKAKTA